MRVLWWQSVGNQIFISKGKPTADPDQIKDHKIRVFSPTHAAVREACGGTPGHGVGQQDARRASRAARSTWPRGQQPDRQSPAVDGGGYHHAHAARADRVLPDRQREGAGSRCRRITARSSWRQRNSEERQSRENVTQDRGRPLHDVSGEGHDRARPDTRPGGRLACLQCQRSCEGYIANNTDLARQLMAAYGKLRTDPCCTAGPSTAGSFSRR